MTNDSFKMLWFYGSSIPKNPENLKLLLKELDSYNDILVCGKQQKSFFERLGIFQNVYDIMEDFADKYKSIDTKKKKLIILVNIYMNTLSMIGD